MHSAINTRTGKLTFAAIAATFGLAASSCTMEDSEQISNGVPLTFEEFEAMTYQEPDTGIYIVNGDTPVDSRDELYEFYWDYYVDGTLIVNTVGGADDIWDATTAMDITYCVSQSSFGSNYSRVVSAMSSAAGAWESAAPGINFVHDSSKDGNCDGRTSGVIFDVRQTNTTQYLARAFFPSTSRRNRNILISTTVYPYDDDNSDPLSLEGVLRHELGHTIGLRHEHTRPESGVCFEDSNWRELTSYDSGSVMHYPQCNGTGDWSLTLTTKDKAGVADLYPGGGGGGGGGGGSCTLAQVGDSCSVDSDCCSNKCKGPSGGKTCK